MKNKNKVILVVLLSAIVVVGFVGIASATIIDHGMSKTNPFSLDIEEDFQLNRTTQFYTTDFRVIFWYEVIVNPEDTFIERWYDPDGNLYDESSDVIPSNVVPSSRWLHASKIPLEANFGEWHIDLYQNGKLKFTEYFTVSPVTPTPTPTPTPVPPSVIQSKIDAANPGDTIMIEDGIYNENVKVNKQLTIRSKNGPDKTIVQAATPEDPVFNVSAGHVDISGFTVKGADTGIYLYHVDYCNISGNNCSSNDVSGIDLLHSNNNSIFNNTCSNNNFGIYLYNSSNNLITNNNVSNNSRVITIDNTTTDDDISWITVGPITITWGDGISLYNSSNNKIYRNNFINNYDNVHPSDLTNIWDSTERITYCYHGTTYTNYLGNYWEDYEGTDVDGDGIGDTPYIIEGDKDNYPLIEPFENYFTYG